MEHARHVTPSSRSVLSKGSPTPGRGLFHPSPGARSRRDSSSSQTVGPLVSSVVYVLEERTSPYSPTGTRVLPSCPRLPSHQNLAHRPGPESSLLRNYSFRKPIAAPRSLRPTHLGATPDQRGCSLAPRTQGVLYRRCLAPANGVEEVNGLPYPPPHTLRWTLWTPGLYCCIPQTPTVPCRSSSLKGAPGSRCPPKDGKGLRRPRWHRGVGSVDWCPRS